MCFFLDGYIIILYVAKYKTKFMTRQVVWKMYSFFNHILNTEARTQEKYLIVFLVFFQILWQKIVKLEYIPHFLDIFFAIHLWDREKKLISSFHSFVVYRKKQTKNILLSDSWLEVRVCMSMYLPILSISEILFQV